MKRSLNKELFSGMLVKENTIFSGTLVKENTMNLSEYSDDKELISLTYVKDITMNLSEYSDDKELFSGTLVKENTNYSLNFILYLETSSICIWSCNEGVPGLYLTGIPFIKDKWSILNVSCGTCIFIFFLCSNFGEFL